MLPKSKVSISVEVQYRNSRSSRDRYKDIHLTEGGLIDMFKLNMVVKDL